MLSKTILVSMDIFLEIICSVCNIYSFIMDIAQQVQTDDVPGKAIA